MKNNEKKKGANKNTDAEILKELCEANPNIKAFINKLELKIIN